MNKTQFVIMLLMSAVSTAEPFAKAGKLGKSSAKIAVALAALRAALTEVAMTEPALVGAPQSGPMKSARGGKPPAAPEFAGFKLKV